MLVTVSVLYKVGPKTSLKWSCKPCNYVFNPSYPFIMPFIGVSTPFITARGPPCVYVCYLFRHPGLSFLEIDGIGKSNFFLGQKADFQGTCSVEGAQRLQ